MNKPNLAIAGKLCRTFIALLAVSILAPARADIAILPLGDSITFGAKLNNAGYRYPLFVDLTQAGIAFHYLGQCADNCQPLPYPAQWHHDGFPGATIKDMSDNLAGSVQGPGMVVPNLGGYWVTSGKADGEAVQPDVVLLLAGTNNIIHAPAQGGTDLAAMHAQFTDLVGWLTKNRPNATLLIGTVLPITRQPPQQNEQVLAFNAWLKSNLAAFGAKCRLVDLYPLFLQPDGTPNAKLLSDGVHPAQAGYDLMGKAWTDVIVALVANGTLKQEAPATFGARFALPTGRESSVSGVSNTRVTPPTAAAGATLSIASTLTAGNNLLTSPVITVSLNDAKGRPLDGFAPVSALHGDVAQHATALIAVSLKLPDKIAPGTYDIGVAESSVEGSSAQHFAAKVTVSP